MARKLYSEFDWEREIPEKENSKDSEPYRIASRKDYARLIHSPAFRRLQGKTQLFPGDESDFFRNRLTHSLEVAQIAKSIAMRVNYLIENNKFYYPKSTPAADKVRQAWSKSVGKIDLDVVEFAGLAHDLGHPPFGHTGEKALDEKMKVFGGFEGNAQTLRILARLEKRKVEQRDTNSLVNNFQEFQLGEDRRKGLNLSSRSLAAILKYDFQIPERRENSQALAKGYYATESELIRKIKKDVLRGYDLKSTEQFRTIEMQIMDMADDIAYSTYDFEDALKAGFISPIELIAKTNSDDELIDAVGRKVFAERYRRKLPAFGLSKSDATDLGKIKQSVIDTVIEMFFDLFISAAASDNIADSLEALAKISGQSPKKRLKLIAKFTMVLSTNVESISRAIRDNG